MICRAIRVSRSLNFPDSPRIKAMASRTDMAVTRSIEVPATVTARLRAQSLAMARRALGLGHVALDGFANRLGRCLAIASLQIRNHPLERRLMGARPAILVLIPHGHHIAAATIQHGAPVLQSSSRHGTSTENP